MRKRRIYFDHDRALIPLANARGVAVVDTDDVAVVGAVSWNWKESHGYARGKRHGQDVSMHRVLCEAEGLDVDHINGDGLDNRRANLRAVAKSVNQRNRHRTTSPSGLIGAHWVASAGKWVSKIRDGERGPDGRLRNHHLGLFATKEEAAAAYLKAKELRDGRHNA